MKILYIEPIARSAISSTTNKYNKTTSVIKSREPSYKEKSQFYKEKSKTKERIKIDKKNQKRYLYKFSPQPL